jgi:hypothetical protein
MDVLLAHIKRGGFNYKFTLHVFSTTSVWIEVFHDNGFLLYRKLQHLNPNGMAWKDDPHGDIENYIPKAVQLEADRLILKAMKLRTFW